MSTVIYHFFRLIRLPNLLIIALLQFLLHHQLLLPALLHQNITPRLDNWHTAQLIFFTVLLAAAGYIINDILDQRADRVNRPESLTVGRHISRRAAIWIYFCFNLVAFLVWLYLCLYLDQLWMLGIFALIALGLYFYSAYLKRRPGFGHLVVSLLCALVVGIVWQVEYPALAQMQEVAPERLLFLGSVFWAYAGFAFWITLIRELIKTLQDEAGDRQAGYLTTPIVWGRANVHRLSFILTILLLCTLLAAAWYLYQRTQMELIAAAILITAIPTIIMIRTLARAPSDTRLYRRLSRWAKVVMLLGILILLLIQN